MRRKIEEVILASLNRGQDYTTTELLDVIADSIPHVTVGTQHWWISRLVQQGVLHRVGRGHYSFNRKELFTPILSKKAKQVYTFLTEELNTNELIIFETGAVNSFIPKDIARELIYVMVPREYLQQSFYFLINKYKDVYLNPNADIVKNYVLQKPQAIILIPMVKQTPVFENKGCRCLSIEGLIVISLLFIENYVKPANIPLDVFIKQIFSTYEINIPKMLRYAARRKIRAQLETYLVQTNLWHVALSKVKKSKV